MQGTEDAQLGQGLRRLGERYGLGDAAVDRLHSLLEQVTSDELAPTAVREPGKILEDHIADSLVALELPVMQAVGSVVDIGSGAGFPGLVLAIARPDLRFVLLEASARKSAFIDRAATRYGLRNVRVVHARAEAWPEGTGTFDLATARALAPLPVVLEYAAPLLRRGGVVIAWRGRRDPAGEAAAVRAAEQLGLRVGEIRPVVPYPGAEHRHLHMATKIADTSPGFPRRPGAARKRPLGAPSQPPSDRLRR